MKKYPQIYVASKYQSFLKQLTTVGKPATVDKAYIKKLGFKSSYDENFLQAIKFIGLVEEKRGGAPTEKWSALRADFAGTLGACLRLGYDDLFAFYPDANLRDDEALNSYFRGNSDGSAEDVGRMVTAFTAVRDIAKFDAIEVKEDEPSEESAPRRENGGAKAKGTQPGFFPASNGLCCTNPVRDSSRESSVVAGLHEQADTADLQDPELASL